jgi:hypothetical protein
MCQLTTVAKCYIEVADGYLTITPHILNVPQQQLNAPFRR